MKEMLKKRRSLGDMLAEKQEEILEAIKKEKEGEEAKEMEAKPQKKKEAVKLVEELLTQAKTSSHTNEDGEQVLKITKEKKKSKKRARKEVPAEKKEEPAGEAQKRVRFDMSKNKVTEFFKHGKVATRVLHKN